MNNTKIYPHLRATYSKSGWLTLIVDPLSWIFNVYVGEACTSSVIVKTLEEHLIESQDFIDDAKSIEHLNPDDTRKNAICGAAWLKRCLQDYDASEDAEVARGVTFVNEGGPITVIIPDFRIDDPRSIAVLAHELIHAVNEFVGRIHVEEYGGKEFFACTHTTLFERILFIVDGSAESVSLSKPDESNDGKPVSVKTLQDAARSASGFKHPTPEGVSKGTAESPFWEEKDAFLFKAGCHVHTAGDTKYSEMELMNPRTLIITRIEGDWIFFDDINDGLGFRLEYKDLGKYCDSGSVIFLGNSGMSFVTRRAESFTFDKITPQWLEENVLGTKFSCPNGVVCEKLDGKFFRAHEIEKGEVITLDKIDREHHFIYASNENGEYRFIDDLFIRYISDRKLTYYAPPDKMITKAARPNNPLPEGFPKLWHEGVHDALCVQKVSDNDGGIDLILNRTRQDVIQLVVATPCKPLYVCLREFTDKDIPEELKEYSVISHETYLCHGPEYVTSVLSDVINKLHGPKCIEQAIKMLRDAISAASSGKKTEKLPSSETKLADLRNEKEILVMMANAKDFISDKYAVGEMFVVDKDIYGFRVSPDWKDQHFIKGQEFKLASIKECYVILESNQNGEFKHTLGTRYDFDRYLDEGFLKKINVGDTSDLNKISAGDTLICKEELKKEDLPGLEYNLGKGVQIEIRSVSTDGKWCGIRAGSYEANGFNIARIEKLMKDEVIVKKTQSV